MKTTTNSAGRKPGLSIVERSDAIGLRSYFAQQDELLLPRRIVAASEKALSELMGKRLEELDILALYLDGIVVHGHHILAAVGVDSPANKHLLGVAQGSSENARVAKDLLPGIIDRGLDPEQHYLFIIDGSKALRAAIEELFGERGFVQRCRTHNGARMPLA